MDILGPDLLVFGVDDVDGCSKFLLDFGLKEIERSSGAVTFAALDGTGVEIRHRDDPSLPASLKTGNMLRQQVYGVRDEQALDAIANELGRDRRVLRLADGSIEVEDDLGFALKFRITRRAVLEMAGERINAPGSPAQRAVNEVAVFEEMPAAPRTLSHVVLFVPDLDKAVAFYTERLGFRITDTLAGAGPFLRPKACDDHHTLFFIRTPDYMQGCEHLAFHMGGPTELMLAGTRFVRAGYQSFWGPGRHKFGSNWFWYFNSPFGCHFEYDADMDKHDDNWIPREATAGAEAGQIFLFEAKDKWFPGGSPTGEKH